MKLQALTVLAVLLLSTMVFAGDVKAVKAASASFTDPFGSGGACTATFTRASSGIINQSDLTCLLPGVNAPVYFQFRPLDGGPNTACNSNGLVFSQLLSTDTTNLPLAYFISGATYNACAYLVNAMVGSAKIEVGQGDGEAGVEGSSSPILPLSGKFRVCVTGTYDSHLTYNDAKYVSWYPDFSVALDGQPATSPIGFDPLQNPRSPLIDWTYLGSTFGEVQVSRNELIGGGHDWEFVPWGAYNAAHNYCRVMSSGNSERFRFRVFDADINGGILSWWWADNVWIDLNYSVTYVGQ